MFASGANSSESCASKYRRPDGSPAQSLLLEMFVKTRAGPPGGRRIRARQWTEQRVKVRHFQAVTSRNERVSLDCSISKSYWSASKWLIAVSGDRSTRTRNNVDARRGTTGTLRDPVSSSVFVSRARQLPTVRALFQGQVCRRGEIRIVTWMYAHE